MPEPVPPPTHDALDGPIPAAADPRPWPTVVADLMVVWDCSKPEAERRAEPYSLGQCETIVREFFASGAWRAR
jgi:hypothetical protein